MPKYPVGYLRVESVRHESVRADSRKRLNSSSQLGPRSQKPVRSQSVHVRPHPSVPERSRAWSHVGPAVVDALAVAPPVPGPASRAPPRRPRRHRRPWSGPARSGAGPPRERETVSGRLVVDSSKVRTMGERAEPQRQLRGTDPAVDRAPGQRRARRPARRHARRADTACLTQCLT